MQDQPSGDHITPSNNLVTVSLDQLADMCNNIAKLKVGRWAVSGQLCHAHTLALICLPGSCNLYLDLFLEAILQLQPHDS